VTFDAITEQDSAIADGPAAGATCSTLNWNAVLLYPQWESHPTM